MKSDTMFYTLKRILFITCAVVIAGCKKDDFQPEESFIKIYNELEGNKKYVPLGIQQTSDQGYLILSAYDGWNILVMKIDKEGNFVSKTQLPSTHVNAVPNLIKHGENYYFVCMDQVGLFSYLMQVDEASGSATEVQNFPNVIYPTCVYSNGTSIYIQNYDRLSYETGIHRLNASLDGIQQSGSVNIFTSVENEIVDHITYNGKRMPFLISSTPENDYIMMSCFYNYSFSLVFLNPNLEFSGVYNGAGFNGGINAILPQGSSTYAVARFSHENQYFNANTALSPTTIDIAESIQTQGYSELDNNKPVIIRTIKIGDTDHTSFVASTKSNQLVMYLFDNSGTLKGKKYIGQNTPYTICDIASTSDGGLMLLIRVKLMGSYDRIATIKLSDEQLKEIVE